jgi:branched-chain amino acid transport system ATP-binding protein/urea transport system ATP-binding protein
MQFGGVTVLKDIDFVLQQGEVRCLIGPNGAGKSTFFKIVTGQIKPTAGKVLFYGDDVTGRATHEIARRGVGTKTQVPQLFDDLSVQENVWLATFRNQGRKRSEALVADSLDEMGMSAHRHDIVGRLAHGLRQRVEIAMVLAGRPRLILLDEPAAGMSDGEVDQIVGVIKTIGRERTVLVVEHDMRFVRAVGTRLTVFHQGRVFLEGAPHDVLADDRVREIYFGGKAA